MGTEKEPPVEKRLLQLFQQLSIDQAYFTGRTPSDWTDGAKKTWESGEPYEPNVGVMESYRGGRGSGPASLLNSSTTSASRGISLMAFSRASGIRGVGSSPVSLWNSL